MIRFPGKPHSRLVEGHQLNLNLINVIKREEELLQRYCENRLITLEEIRHFLELMKQLKEQEIKENAIGVRLLCSALYYFETLMCMQFEEVNLLMAEDSPIPMTIACDVGDRLVVPIEAAIRGRSLKLLEAFYERSDIKKQLEADAKLDKEYFLCLFQEAIITYRSPELESQLEKYLSHYPEMIHDVNLRKGPFDSVTVNETALELAIKEENSDAISFLVKKGAKVELKHLYDVLLYNLQPSRMESGADMSEKDLINLLESLVRDPQQLKQLIEEDKQEKKAYYNQDELGVLANRLNYKKIATWLEEKGFCSGNCSNLINEVDFLIKIKKSLRKPDETAESTLVSEISTFLEKVPHDIYNEHSSFGALVCYAALYAGYPEIVRPFARYGFNVNKAHGCFTNFLGVLIQLAYEETLKNSYGESSAEFVRTIDVLFDCGLKMESQAGSPSFLLDFITQMPNAESSIVKLFQKKVIDKKCFDHKGRTAFNYCVNQMEISWKTKKNYWAGLSVLFCDVDNQADLENFLIKLECAPIGKLNQWEKLCNEIPESNPITKTVAWAGFRESHIKKIIQNISKTIEKDSSVERFFQYEIFRDLGENITENDMAGEGVSELMEELFENLIKKSLAEKGKAIQSQSIKRIFIWLDTLKKRNITFIKDGIVFVKSAFIISDESLALACLDYGVDVNGVIDNQYSLIMGAVRKGFVSFALALLERGANVQYRDPAGETAWSCALKGKSFELMVAICDVNSQESIVELLKKMRDAKLSDEDYNGYLQKLNKRGFSLRACSFPVAVLLRNKKQIQQTFEPDNEAHFLLLIEEAKRQPKELFWHDCLRKTTLELTDERRALVKGCLPLQKLLTEIRQAQKKELKAPLKQSRALMHAAEREREQQLERERQRSLLEEERLGEEDARSSCIIRYEIVKNQQRYFAKEDARSEGMRRYAFFLQEKERRVQTTLSLMGEDDRSGYLSSFLKESSITIEKERKPNEATNDPSSLPQGLTENSCDVSQNSRDSLLDVMSMLGEPALASSSHREPVIIDEYGNTASHHVVICNDESACKDLFARGLFDANTENQAGFSPLLLAINNMNVALIRLILEKTEMTVSTLRKVIDYKRYVRQDIPELFHQFMRDVISALEEQLVAHTSGSSDERHVVCLRLPVFVPMQVVPMPVLVGVPVPVPVPVYLVPNNNFGL